ncbi:MAG: OmpA family protein, partial [Myxococcota bacterium]
DLAPGIVHLKVTDSKGRPVEAAVRFGQTAPVALADGRGMAKVPPGSWSVTVTSPTLGSRTVALEVESGLTSSLDLALQPALVVIGRDKIELREKLRFDGTTLLPENGLILDEVVAVLKAHPEVTGVRIEGHTDSRGPAEDNLTRSGARAAAVLAYLVERGIDPGRLVVAGYGEARPIDWADTPAAWEKNDRIELVISARAE